MNRQTTTQVSAEAAQVGLYAVPAETLLRLFLRFLRFGALAWGGPVVQIAMLRQELVDEERWISSEQFNRVLAVYQVLPGPEAHEMCVYFGMLSRGRLGGLLAGLGFMLPGFVLMFLLSWLYVRYGLKTTGAFAFPHLAAPELGVALKAAGVGGSRRSCVAPPGPLESSSPRCSRPLGSWSYSPPLRPVPRSAPTPRRSPVRCRRAPRPRRCVA